MISMLRHVTCLIIGVVLCACLAACSEEQAAPASKTTNVQSKPPAKSVTPPQEAVVETEVAKEEEFVYETEGRRDPFMPLSRIVKPVVKAVEEEPQTPLQSYDVVQFKLIGVIVGMGDPKAMVVAPDGKSYVLARGVKIGKNNGVIVDITSDAVSIQETYYDFSGNVIENIQEITVPRREGV
jgi:type IV pilus assembly protein PilP